MTIYINIYPHNHVYEGMVSGCAQWTTDAQEAAKWAEIAIEKPVTVSIRVADESALQSLTQKLSA